MVVLGVEECEFSMVHSALSGLPRNMAKIGECGGDKIDYQVLIDRAVEYIREIPPRKLRELGEKYNKGEIKVLLEEVEVKGIGERRAKRASFDEDEHTRDESTPAKWLQTATSTTELTHSIRLARFIRFALASLKMHLASLGAAMMQPPPDYAVQAEVATDWKLLEENRVRNNNKKPKERKSRSIGRRRSVKTTPAPNSSISTSTSTSTSTSLKTTTSPKSKIKLRFENDDATKENNNDESFSHSKTAFGVGNTPPRPAPAATLMMPTLVALIFTAGAIAFQHHYNYNTTL